MSYYYQDNRFNHRPSDADERDRRGDRPRSHSREPDSALPSTAPHSYSSYDQFSAPPAAGGSSPRISSRDDFALSPRGPPESYTQTGRRAYTTNVMSAHNSDQQSESIPSRDAQSQSRRARTRDAQDAIQRSLPDNDPMSSRSFSLPSSYSPHFQPPRPSYPSTAMRSSGSVNESETVQMPSQTERQRHHLPQSSTRDPSRPCMTSIGPQ